ncbi:uncharacterized protein B0H18DRAFT_953858 [Fomitopsis serialis]|uniref:uncharacterized protein n=1 Tax=Fomitopsis serialis TaxID=139415 RepID=UPI0020081BF2|nr:uncharacterized protein B0H18DRAFT_953858 [Neoantrodia serialis]KAH9928607.1 hypothetical protein B0H18DRAFT_953858 [Neoantrodia serialis]
MSHNRYASLASVLSLDTGPDTASDVGLSDSETESVPPQTPTDVSGSASIATHYSPGSTFTDNLESSPTAIAKLSGGKGGRRGPLNHFDNFKALHRFATTHVAQPEDTHLIFGYLRDISTLWEQWVDGGQVGFVVKEILGITEREFLLLQTMVEESWDWEVSEDLVKYVAFLRTINMDFWPGDGRVVLQAPTFSEDFSINILFDVASMLRLSSAPFNEARPTVAYKTDVKNTDVQFTLRHSAVVKDIEAVPGTEIFLTLVTDTRQEFVYQMKKCSQIAAALPSLTILQGFIVAMIGPAEATVERHDLYSARRVPPGAASQSMEVCVVVYTSAEFARFRVAASGAMGFEDWVEDPNFMIKTYAADVPADGFRLLDEHIHRIVLSHASNIAQRSLLAPPRSEEMDTQLLEDVCQGAGDKVVRWLHRVVYEKLSAIVCQRQGLGKPFIGNGQQPYYAKGLSRNAIACMRRYTGAHVPVRREGDKPSDMADIPITCTAISLGESPAIVPDTAYIIHFGFTIHAVVIQETGVSQTPQQLMRKCRDMVARNLIPACGVLLVFVHETRGAPNTVPDTVPQHWINATQEELALKAKNEANQAGPKADPDDANNAQAARKSISKLWGPWELLGTPPSKFRERWHGHIVPPVALRGIVLHGATQLYAVAVLPSEYGLFDRAVEEHWSLHKVLEEFKSMEFCLKMGSTPHSTEDAVEEFRKRLLMMAILTNKLLKAIVARETNAIDNDVPGILHHFPGVTSTLSNSVLLSVAEQDIPGFYTTLPSLDPSDPDVADTFNIIGGTLTTSLLNNLAGKLPSRVLDYVTCVCQVRLRKAVDAKIASEAALRKKLDGKKRAKREAAQTRAAKVQPAKGGGSSGGGSKGSGS